MSRSGEAARRFAVVRIAGLVVALVLVARLVQVQVVQHARHRAAADRQWLQSRIIQPHRGDIYDRHGRPLALTVSSCRVGVAGSLVENRRELAGVLAGILDVDATAMERRLARVGGGHAVLSRQAFLDEQQQRELRRYAAVTLDDQIGRVYPLDGVGASLLGFFRQDPDSTIHRTGLEFGLDSLLVGTPGRAMRIRSGNPGEDHGDVVAVPVRHGADVVLTVDADLQEICEARLDAAVAESRSKAGSVLIMDPRNGDVLAAASWPLVRTREERVGDAACWINRNITACYEPGSVLKIFTAASLLASGAVDTATVFDCADGQFDGFRIREAAGHEYGRLSFMEGFSHSSNVWFARAVANLSPPEQYRALLDFGFGRGTGVSYPGESDGILAPPAGWSSRSQATIAIGQEIAVTPLQLGLAVSAVANGGTLFAPRMYSEVRDADGELLTVNPPRRLRQVLPRGLDQMLRLAMRRVVTGGTGVSVDRDWVAIGGKTGTAQKSVPGRGFADGLHTATFVGMLPVEEPRLVIVTVLDEPCWAKHYAAQSAAPLFADVVDDIRRTTDWLTDVDRSCQRVVVAPAPRTAPVPDVMFLTSDGADRRLRRAGFAVRGAAREGVVVAQVPTGGSRLAPGDTVRVTVRARGGETGQVCPDVIGLSNREVRALAARLGVPLRITGVGYVERQHPEPGARLSGKGLEVRMANPWR